MQSIPWAFKRSRITSEPFRGVVAVSLLDTTSASLAALSRAGEDASTGASPWIALEQPRPSSALDMPPCRDAGLDQLRQCRHPASSLSRSDVASRNR